MALIEVLHQEFQRISLSLEFTQQRIENLTKENKSLHLSVNNLTTQLSSVNDQLVSITTIAEYKFMNETILDLQ